MCGIFRGDRKGNTHTITKAKLKKREFDWCQSGSAVVCKWKNKRDVLNISNQYIKPKMDLLLTDVGIKSKSLLLFAIVITDYLVNLWITLIKCYHITQPYVKAFHGIKKLVFTFLRCLY